MRNISFSMTTAQFKDRSKTVTRRLGWGCVIQALKQGRPFKLMGCEKCMGRKVDEPLVRLGPIEIVSAHWEPLQRMIDDPVYGKAECVREGFPDWTPEQFVQFFCKGHKLPDGRPCTPASLVNRMEFRYLDPA